MPGSKLYRADSQAAKDAAYRSPVNPFEEGTRRHRLFGKWRHHHDCMEADFADLAMAYGQPWPPEGARLRHPPMSLDEARAAPPTPGNSAAIADMEWWGARLPQGWALQDHMGREHAHVLGPVGQLLLMDGERLAALAGR